LQCADQNLLNCLRREEEICNAGVSTSGFKSPLLTLISTAGGLKEPFIFEPKKEQDALSKLFFLYQKCRKTYLKILF
jgi:hypothetical protein